MNHLKRHNKSSTLEGFKFQVGKFMAYLQTLDDYFTSFLLSLPLLAIIFQCDEYLKNAVQIVILCFNFGYLG